MTMSIRWNVAVSAETDAALRSFLARQGMADEGGLSRFVEDAVRAHLLELSAEAAKAANAALEAQTLEAMIDEALDWARRQP